MNKTQPHHMRHTTSHASQSLMSAASDAPHQVALLKANARLPHIERRSGFFDAANNSSDCSATFRGTEKVTVTAAHLDGLISAVIHVIPGCIHSSQQLLSGLLSWHYRQCCWGSARTSRGLHINTLLIQPLPHLHGMTPCIPTAHISACLPSTFSAILYACILLNRTKLEDSKAGYAVGIWGEQDTRLESETGHAQLLLP